MRRACGILGALIALHGADALYSANSHVLQLDEKGFKDEVLNSDAVSMVEFYAPWCGHCKSLVPEWDKAATALAGIVNVVAIDATKYEGLAQKYGIQGFPTIKVFGVGKTPKDYQGARDANGIVQEAMRAVQSLVQARQSGKAKPKGSGGASRKEKKDRSGGRGGGGGGGGGSSGGGGSERAKPASDVVEVTSANFKEVVLDSPEPVILEFYAPWCGHCKALEPEYAKAAFELRGQPVKLAAVDATAHKDLAEKFKIEGFPTILTFKAGAKKSPEPYKGVREADAILAHALSMVDIPPPPQLTDPSHLGERCAGNKLCVIAFLPHIMDASKQEREKHIGIVADAAKMVSPTLFGFLWSEGGAQEKLESAMGLTFGYPVVVAYSAEKKAFAMHVGSFQPTAIAEFLIGVTTGSTKSSKLGELPQIEAAAAWDGNDAPQIEEAPLDESFWKEL